MEFLFAKDHEIDLKELQQGDLIIRDKTVQDVLSQAHQYYATAPSYTHFIVITQSCDLVRRGTRSPKAPYITVAAVRPFNILLDRFLRRHAFSPEAGEKYGLYDVSRREVSQQYLERLLNNEERGVFFIRGGSHPSVKEDLCAFLPLSVALKADHYDKLLAAKIAQLDDIFAAKLGWLVGNLYSRIATPDLEERSENGEELKEKFFQEKLDDDATWLSSTRWKALNKAMREEVARVGGPLSRESVSKLVAEVPSDMDFLARRAIEILRTNRVLENDQGLLQRAENLLRNDQNLASIARALR